MVLSLTSQRSLSSLFLAVAAAAAAALTLLSGGAVRAFSPAFCRPSASPVRFLF
jgi:hypothetical protein